MATSIEFLKNMLSNSNIQAALKTIRMTECNDAPECYQYLFGSTVNNDIRFTDYSKHPNSMQVHNGIDSTAAGAYQILYRTYNELCQKYGFDGSFDPAAQDLMAVAIFDEIGVLMSVSKGLMLQEDVMTKLALQWASLPYSRYNQNPKTIAQVRAIYLAAGGSIGGD